VLSSVDLNPDAFICSNPLVNQLQHNIQWGQRSNYFEVPTDCPQRDERLGWMATRRFSCAPAASTPTSPPL